MSYCKIVAMGRLVSDPELRKIPSGTPVCEFRMAFDNGWGDNKKTCFVSVTAWGKQAEFVERYFSKGKGIVVDGRLDMDEWNDKESGNKRTKHYITAERVVFPVGGKSDGGQSGGGAGQAAGGSQAQGGGKQGGWGNDPSMDEIPF